MKNSRIEHFLRVAKEASVIGGFVLKDYFGKLLSDQVYFKGEKDLVSQADRESEDRIREYILKHFPDHSVVGEENGGDARGDAIWFIDPLDGTKNFVSGFPIFGVSVGFVMEGIPIVGAVYLPYFNSLYYAGESLGAYKDGKRIYISKRDTLKKMSVSYGFPSRAKRDLNLYWEIFKDVFEKVGSMRRPGAAAVDLCFLAEGIFDGLIEFELNPWDVVAGMVIVKEAGGMVKLTKGLTNGTDVIAGSPYIFPYLEEVVKLKLGV
ncbi:inositol monophosphatase family protein [Thermocrinis sp.]